MLSWMLKSGECAPDPDAGETTRLEEPDTPAPVFAARALKSALFGTPIPQSDDALSQPERNAGLKSTKAAAAVAVKAEKGAGTLSKPPGILLTPGTSTSRRKRVSFGYDLVGASKSGLGKEIRKAKVGDGQGRSRNENPSTKSHEEVKTADMGPSAADSEGDWEEDEGDDACVHDMTTDLNEPHSESGRYWKGQFEKYHQEAKAEMEKLLKYKQLAKSYARQKDAEAIQLAERLRVEQQKVIKMERNIAENASHIVSRHRCSSDNESTDLFSKLSKQTASAAQYRRRVQELERELDKLVGSEEGTSERVGRCRRQTAAKTLVETQKELRRARSQLRELDSLREEVSFLKAAAKEEGDGKSSTTSTRARALKAQLEQSREESNRKKKELCQLGSAFEALRRESDAQAADTKAVLERAHANISDLKMEIRALKLAGSEQHRAGGRRLCLGASQEPDGGMAGKHRFTRHQEVAGREKGSTDDEAHVDHNFDKPESRRVTKMREEPNDGTDALPAAASGALTGRTSHAKPRWQPFVPRSPQSRALVCGVEAPRYKSSARAEAKPVATMAPDLVVRGRAVSWRIGAPPATFSSDDDGGEIDLLRGRFSRLGEPPADAGRTVSSTPVAEAPRGRALPPERRAAALARIEKRMADKRLAQRRAADDKENLRP